MNHRAFTLIELLAATTLTGVLMVALMTIVGTVTAAERQLLHLPTSDGTLSRLRELIRDDLVHARDVQTDDDGTVMMIGYHHIDRRTLESSHHPVRIEWRVERMANHSLLTRTQTTLNDPLNRVPWRQRIYPGVAGFNIAPDEPARDIRGERDEQVEHGKSTLPLRMYRVNVSFSGIGQSAIAWNVVLP